MGYRYQLLSAADLEEMNTAWDQRREAVFERAVIDRFISEMLYRSINKDIKGQLMERIKTAKKLSELWVTAPLCFEHSYRFVDARFPGMSLGIEQLINGTDALSQLAAKLGPCIKVRPLRNAAAIFLKVEFWPTA